MHKILVLLNGLPGSGKTEYSREWEPPVVVRPDFLRREWGHIYQESLEPMILATCLAMAGMALQEHDVVMVDECFPRPDTVEPWRKVARKHEALIRMEVMATAPWLCTTRKLKQADGAPWKETILRMATEMFDNWGKIKELCDGFLMHDLNETMFLMGLGQWKRQGGEGDSWVPESQGVRDLAVNS